MRTNGWSPNVPQHVTTFHRSRSELVLFSYDVQGMAIASHSTIITPDYCTASAAYSSATKSEGADSRCPKNANCSMVRQRTDPFQTWGSWTQRRSISQSQYVHQVTGYIWIHILLQPITVFPRIQNACVSLFSYDLYYFCCTPREVSRPQAARASSSSGRDVRFVQGGIPKIS